MAQQSQPPGTAVTTRLGPLTVRVTGAGPTALLWHSLFVDSTTWARVEQPLASGRRLVLVDGPCHGANPPITRPFTLDDCAGAAIDILDHFGVDEPVDWLGNAWGGHVGILFAASYPDRCRSLVAIGAPVHALSRADRRRTVLLAALYRVAGPRSVVNPLVDALLGPRARVDDPEGAAIVADAFRRAERRGMYAAIRWLSLRRPDLTPALDSLGTPTLLTTGTSDPMWTTANARAAVAHLSRGALVILPGAGISDRCCTPRPSWSSWSPPSGETPTPRLPASAAPQHHPATRDVNELNTSNGRLRCDPPTIRPVPRSLFRK